MKSFNEWLVEYATPPKTVQFNSLADILNWLRKAAAEKSMSMAGRRLLDNDVLVGHTVGGELWNRITLPGYNQARYAEIRALDHERWELIYKNGADRFLIVVNKDRVIEYSDVFSLNPVDDLVRDPANDAFQDLE